MDREAKRRLICDLRSIRGVTASAVLKILEVLQPPGDEQISWRAVQEAPYHALAAQRSHIELPLENGGTFRWTVLLPQQALPYYFRQCEGFRRNFEAALGLHPNNHACPWRLAFYHDEVTPGNVLRPDNRRKMTAIYWSLLELDGFLRCEEAWMCLGVIRSSKVKQIQGGMSNVMRLLLRTVLLGPNGVTSCGIALPRRVLFLRYAAFIADEDACRSTWAVKGASGLKPCMDCKNVLKAGADTGDGSYLVCIDCSDPRRFDPMTDNDWRDAHRSLEALRAAGVNKTEFERHERAMGLRYVPAGMLSDDELCSLVRPSFSTRDPMHVMLSTGVLSSEVYLLLHAWAGASPGFRYAEVAAFCSADFQFPKHRAKVSAADVFSVVRETASLSAGCLKAGSSELLAVYPLVRHFVELVIEPSGRIPASVKSFFACCDVADAMQKVKQSGPSQDSLRALRRSTAKALRLHLECYGSEHVRPKHHFMLHAADQAARDGVWLDAFVHERKHQTIKAAAEGTKNTTSFEESVLAMTLMSTERQMASVCASTLCPPSATSPELSVALGSSVRVSNQMRFEFTPIAAKDVVVLGAGEAVVVLACAQSGPTLYLMVRHLHLLRRDSTRTTRWSFARERAMRPLRSGDGVRHPACWYREEDHLVILGL